MKTSIIEPLKNLIQKSHYTILLASAIFLCSLLSILLFIEQADFHVLAPVYSLAFGAYLYLILLQKGKQSKHHFSLIILVAILIRFIAIFTFPGLSDDIYRFIWDGYLLDNGFHPFHETPSQFLANPLTEQPFLEALYPKLNSPDYHTIYPPIAQASFWLAYQLGGQSIMANVIVMKAIQFVFECGTIYLMLQILKQLKLPKWSVLIYALNPLIIIEISGNMHFEGAMIFFVILAYYLLLADKKNTLVGSSLAFAAAVASKLLPLLLLPLLFLRLPWRKAILYYILVGIFTLLFFIPLINMEFINGFGESLNLYFQKFEFNASIYYIARWIGEQQVGYNLIHTIGPSLSKFAAILIVLTAFIKKQAQLQDFPKYAIIAFSIYLFCATTIHPWYVSLLLAFCVFTTNIRFPILWSFLIMFTYINYIDPVYHEYLWVVAIEYSLLFIYILYEWKVKPNPSL